MIDAVSGAIYVIGGVNYLIGGDRAAYYQDVWVSTDGGAPAGLGGGGGGGGG